MYKFKDLLKRIREESGLTQEELGRVLDVSTVLITMVETGKKEASKNLVVRLAERLEVRPSSLMPFVLEDEDAHRVTGVEKALVDAGVRLQNHLIAVKAKKLRQYVV